MATLITIQHGTPVRYRGGGTYRVSTAVRQGDGEAPVHVTIAGESGEVFGGSPEQARQQGFAFGDEEFYSNARPISHYDLPTIVTLAERQFVGASVTGDELRNVIQFAISAGLEIPRLNTALTQTRAMARSAQDELRTFREEVRTAIVEAQKEHDLCREGTNTVLENLGLKKITPTWSVEVTRDSDGATIATIKGVEADSDSEAETLVRDSFTVNATVKAVEYGYEYDGEGEADFDEQEWEDDDVSDEDDEFADNHKNDLTFSATEE